LRVFMKLPLFSVCCAIFFSGVMPIGYAHAMTVEEIIAQNKKLVQDRNRVECMRKAIKTRSGFIGSMSITHPIYILKEHIARKNC
ncbi:hypothetical protein, partial [Yersinia bercovieri]